MGNMTGIEREPVLPTNSDRSSWTPKEKMAFAWVLDRVANEALNEALGDLELQEEAEEKIRAAASVGRTGFIGYIRDLTGVELTTEEFGHVMWEIGWAAQQIEEQGSTAEGGQ